MSFANINIKVPEDMVAYVTPRNEWEELTRNALLLYPHIVDLSISHGKAAEILGVHKRDLIELYDKLGLAYLSMDISDVDRELANWEKMRDGAQ